MAAASEPMRGPAKLVYAAHLCDQDDQSISEIVQAACNTRSSLCRPRRPAPETPTAEKQNAKENAPASVAVGARDFECWSDVPIRNSQPSRQVRPGRTSHCRRLARAPQQLISPPVWKSHIVFGTQIGNFRERLHFHLQGLRPRRSIVNLHRQMRQYCQRYVDLLPIG